MTVEQVKKMAVGHFSNPLEAVGGDDRTSADGCKTGGGGRSYRLVLVREARPLMEANSIQLEQLLDNGESSTLRPLLHCHVYSSFDTQLFLLYLAD